MPFSYLNLESCHPCAGNKPYLMTCLNPTTDAQRTQSIIFTSKSSRTSAPQTVTKPDLSVGFWELPTTDQTVINQWKPETYSQCLIASRLSNLSICVNAKIISRKTAQCGELSSLSRHQGLVEPDGIEPTTSCLQSRRSPN